MSEVKDTLKEYPSLRFGAMLLGMLITSIGVNGFLRPAHLLSGGATGISTAINYLTGINIGLLTFIVNMPVFILGFIYLEKEFCILSLINMAIFSFMLGITSDVSQIIPIQNDVILQAIYGGLLSGAGVGLVFRTKASTGGTDIIAAILKVKRNIEMKDTTMAINAVIIFVGSFLFGLDLALYTLISIFMNVTTMNFVKDAMNSQKAVMIVSDNYDEIAEHIMQEIVRGVTFLEAEGAYTHNKKRIIYTVVSTNEIPKIKEISLKYDNKAFISVNDITEVKGRGFKAKDL
ncbi:YitT family protein [Peptacetobacter hominis]|uniref:YitT family protein n=1 Tax=Peptacetobacter hominis TaxID=2743610 RepID=A0A544QYP0_9FIRM|nr:YitT family protein [Peptacetobacter hominis]TQQ85833.1 YitT family protein [Peptacetobacter hominis]